MSPQQRAVAIYGVKRRAGLRKVVGGVDYTRCAEYPMVLEEACLEDAERILEIGASNLFLGCYLADTYDAEVHLCDLDPVVMLQERWIRAIGREDLISRRRFVVSVEDARDLTYDGATFDRIISVSTLEHVREVEKAMKEVGRVLKPGGIAVVSVPFSTHREQRWVTGPLYGHGRRGEDRFYEYIFDRLQLDSAIIGPSGLSVRSLRFLGEPGLKLSRVVYHPLIGWPFALTRWMWPWLAHRWYREIGENEVTPTAENIAVVTLERRRSSEDRS